MIKVCEESGNFKCDRDECFVKDELDGKVKVIKRMFVESSDIPFFCDRCQSEYAVQLDYGYKKNHHDATLCKKCIDELDNIKF